MTPLRPRTPLVPTSSARCSTSGVPTIMANVRERSATPFAPAVDPHAQGLPHRDSLCSLSATPTCQPCRARSTLGPPSVRRLSRSDVAFGRPRVAAHRSSSRIVTGRPRLETISRSRCGAPLLSLVAFATPPGSLRTARDTRRRKARSACAPHRLPRPCAAHEPATRRSRPPTPPARSIARARPDAMSSLRLLRQTGRATLTLEIDGKNADAHRVP